MESPSTEFWRVKLGIVFVGLVERVIVVEADVVRRIEGRTYSVLLLSCWTGCVGTSLGFMRSLSVTGFGDDEGVGRAPARQSACEYSMRSFVTVVVMFVEPLKRLDVLATGVLLAVLADLVARVCASDVRAGFVQASCFMGGLTGKAPAGMGGVSVGLPCVNFSARCVLAFA